MKEAALIIIKPDGICKKLTGNILDKFSQSNLDMVAIRVVKITRAIAEEHYKQLKEKPFFEELVSYFSGDFHKIHSLLAIIYYGNNAIKVCREIAGATNPEVAAPDSIRGAFGRITTAGIFENVVHVSSDKEEAKREIKLWFDPTEIIVSLYPTRTKTINHFKRKVWS